MIVSLDVVFGERGLLTVWPAQGRFGADGKVIDFQDAKYWTTGRGDRVSDGELETHI
jgi:hypothetical protein